MDRTRNQGQKPLKGIVYVWQGKGKGHCQLHKGLMMWHGVVALCTLSFFFGRAFSVEEAKGGYASSLDKAQTNVCIVGIQSF